MVPTVDRGAVGRLLVDRHRRGQALDEVDVRLVHLPEELAGVGRQRLDVAALAFREDGVEGQAGLARAGEPREHDHRVAGQVEVDVLEVVLAGAADDEPVHVIPVSRSGSVPVGPLVGGDRWSGAELGPWLFHPLVERCAGE